MSARLNSRAVALVLALAAVRGTAAAAPVEYPLVTVKNNTIYAASGKVKYASALCKDDDYSVAAGGTWTAKSRGVCLVTGITASLSGAGRNVTSYSSSGTSYSKFFIQASQTEYRVYSDAEMKADVGSVEGKSPGFYIVNKTDWPVSIGIMQVGCLYYGTVPKGGVFKRQTGAVWFTIKANIQPDGKEPRTDWDCVKPVAAVVGSIAIAAATAGIGAFVGLPAAAAGTAAAALAPIATSTGTIVFAAAVSGGAGAAATFTATQLGTLLSKNGAGELKGQFAGPDWPFRCDQMPTYHIVGGPTLSVVNGQATLNEGQPLKIVKQNTCGNSMM